MSQRMTKSAALPGGDQATVTSLTAGIATALKDLEDRVIAAGLRPIWDTFEIKVDTDWVDASTHQEPAIIDQVRFLEVSVLCIGLGEAVFA